MNDMDKNILIFLEKYKAITVNQCKRMFFQNGEEMYRRDRAKKKLKQMEENELLKSYTNNLTREKVYYITDKLSAHDLYIFDFYTKLFEIGCTDIKMQLQPRYLKDMIRPDAFIQFIFGGYIYFILLEIDLTHFTGLAKMQEYERLYKQGELKEQCYGQFPMIIVVGINTIKYQSNNFEVVYLDFKLDGIERLLISNC